MKTKNEKVVKEIMDELKNGSSLPEEWFELIQGRIEKLVEGAPIADIMEATAKLGRYELEEFAGQTVDYDLNSIPVIDEFIKKHRVIPARKDDCNHMAGLWLGAFLGKVMVNELEGTWICVVKINGVIPMGSVLIEGRIFVHPFTRIEDMFNNVCNDSIASYVNGIDVLRSFNPAKSNQDDL